jgi:hypothetical protein
MTTNEPHLGEIIEFDVEKLDYRSALTGVVVLAAALMFVGVLGPAGMAAGIAAIFVVAGGSSQAHASPLNGILFVLVGACVTLLVGYSAESALAATLVIGIVTLLATLASLGGVNTATAGVYLLLWSILALSFGGTDEEPWVAAVAFLIGGTLAITGLWIAARVAPEPSGTPSGNAAEQATDPEGPAANSWSVERFAVLRALGAAACVALGYWWFPDHPTWASLSFILVLRPPKEEAVITGIGRTLGTVAGVVVGILFAQVVGDSTASLLIAFAVCGFLMLATREANYAVSTGFTTAMLLLAQRLIQEDVYSTGWQRLFATILGIAVAFAVIWLMSVTRRLGQRTT